MKGVLFLNKPYIYLKESFYIVRNSSLTANILNPAILL